MPLEGHTTIDIAIVAAVPRELLDLDRLLADPRECPCLDIALVVGRSGPKAVLLAPLGFGKVNAAATMAALAARADIRQVWHVGCAGAFAAGHMEIGDVLVTDRFLCGDEGVLAGDGLRPQSEIGFPLVVRDGHAYYDAFPGDETLLGWARRHTPPGAYRLAAGRIRRTATEEPPGLKSAGEGSEAGVFHIVYGPSLTVSQVSGDGGVAAERFARYQPLAENMEGSAVAQTCLRFRVPMLECRAISNRAGDRDKGRWQLDRALAHCHAVIAAWLEAA
jgi:futalosine hydrolase